ncbi:MAG: hypothetical protein J6S21_02325, partial [Victivallales bacterium]|nr:hypothetical protein [Victivallales bacterium]
MTSQDETKKFTQSDIDCTIKITDDQLSEQGRRAKRHTGIDTTDGFGDISSTRLLIRELSNLGGIVDLVRDVVSSDNAPQEECDLSVTSEQGWPRHFSPVATDLPNREDLPKLLQQYAPGNTFAAGGQGLLSQAKDLILKRPVALKSLRRELLDKPELVKAFITEALITAQLCHPAVVSI